MVPTVYPWILILRAGSLLRTGSWKFRIAVKNQILHNKTTYQRVRTEWRKTLKCTLFVCVNSVGLNYTKHIFWNNSNRAHTRALDLAAELLPEARLSLVSRCQIGLLNGTQCSTAFYLITSSWWYEFTSEAKETKKTLPGNGYAYKQARKLDVIVIMEVSADWVTLACSANALHWQNVNRPGCVMWRCVY